MAIGLSCFSPSEVVGRDVGGVGSCAFGDVATENDPGIFDSATAISASVISTVTPRLLLPAGVVCTALICWAC